MPEHLLNEKEFRIKELKISICFLSHLQAQKLEAGQNNFLFFSRSGIKNGVTELSQIKTLLDRVNPKLVENLNSAFTV